MPKGTQFSRKEDYQAHAVLHFCCRDQSYAINNLVQFPIKRIDHLKTQPAYEKNNMQSSNGPKLELPSGVSTRKLPANFAERDRELFAHELEKAIPKDAPPGAAQSAHQFGWIPVQARQDS